MALKIMTSPMTWANARAAINEMNIQLYLDAGLVSEEAYTPTTDVTALTDDVVWYENNFYIPDGVTTFTFTDGTTDMVATFDVSWSFDEAVPTAEELLASENVMARWVAAEENLTHGSPVSQWNDISGNGRHLVQADPLRQPTWGSVAQEIIFDESNLRYIGSSGEFNQPLSVFLVMKRITHINGGRFFCGEGPSGSIYQASTSTSIIAWSGDTLIHSGGVGDDYIIVRVVFNGANSYIRINDGLKSEGNLGSNSLNNRITLGSNGATSAFDYSNVAYKEAIIWNGVISDEDSDIIHNYLVTQHSIS